MGKKRKLTLLQERFINFWFETGGNATEAARLAGYSPKAPTGSLTLDKPNVQEVIVKRLENEAIKANEVLWRLGQIGRMDVSPYVKQDGDTLSVDVNRLIEDGNGHWIKSIKHTPNGDVVELYNKQRALEQLLKYYKVDAPHLQINADNRTLVLDFGDFNDEDSKNRAIPNQITQDAEEGSS